jgi:hypothetical protein
MGAAEAKRPRVEADAATPLDAGDVAGNLMLKF